MNKEDIRTIVRQVVSELAGDSAPEGSVPAQARRAAPSGLNILSVFHAGVRRLDEAIAQIEKLEATGARSSVYTAASARSWVCGADVRERTGTRCILDTVKTDGLQRVLQHADILVLPTFCFKVAAKVSRLIADDDEAALVLSALMQGKRVVAARDGFQFFDSLANDALRQEIQRVLDRLQSFGMVLCDTDSLFQTVQTVAAGNPQKVSPLPSAANRDDQTPAHTLVGARAVQAAVDEGRRTIKVAPRGIVTPLARDIAREYGIVIEKTEKAFEEGE